MASRLQGGGIRSSERDEGVPSPGWRDSELGLEPGRPRPGSELKDFKTFMKPDKMDTKDSPSKPYRHLAHLPPTTDTPIVFITVTTHDRRQILNCPEAHAELAALWKRSGEIDGWFVGDYLLMPDHVHLFAKASRESKRMATWMQMWKSVSARSFGKAFGAVAPVWQSDYFDRYLRSGESYSEKWMYVELNPVRAGLVAKAEDWKFRGRICDLRF